MLDEVDTFQFILARDLSLRLSDIDAMPYEEYVRWRNFYRYERHKQEFAEQVARDQASGQH